MIVKMTYTLLIIGLSSYLFFRCLESFLRRRHILLMIKVMKKDILGIVMVMNVISYFVMVTIIDQESRLLFS